MILITLVVLSPFLTLWWPLALLATIRLGLLFATDEILIWIFHTQTSCTPCFSTVRPGRWHRTDVHRGTGVCQAETVQFNSWTYTVSDCGLYWYSSPGSVGGWTSASGAAVPLLSNCLSRLSWLELSLFPHSDTGVSGDRVSEPKSSNSVVSVSENSTGPENSANEEKHHETGVKKKTPKPVCGSGCTTSSVKLSHHDLPQEREGWSHSGWPREVERVSLELDPETAGQGGLFLVEEEEPLKAQGQMQSRSQCWPPTQESADLQMVTQRLNIQANPWLYVSVRLASDRKCNTAKCKEQNRF